MTQAPDSTRTSRTDTLLMLAIHSGGLCVAF